MQIQSEDFFFWNLNLTENNQCEVKLNAAMLKLILRINTIVVDRCNEDITLSVVHFMKFFHYILVINPIKIQETLDKN